jgi:hypothetical protein
MATQDRRHRPRRNAELGSDPVLSTPLVATQLKDGLFDSGGGPPRAPSWSRRPVEQTSRAFGPEAGHPPVGALARYAEFLRDVSDRAAVGDDAFDEQSTAVWGQASVSVDHEDLLGE